MQPQHNTQIYRLSLILSFSLIVSISTAFTFPAPELTIFVLSATGLPPYPNLYSLASLPLLPSLSKLHSL